MERVQLRYLLLCPPRSSTAMDHRERKKEKERSGQDKNKRADSKNSFSLPVPAERPLTQICVRVQPPAVHCVCVISQLDYLCLFDPETSRGTNCSTFTSALVKHSFEVPVFK